MGYEVDRFVGKVMDEELQCRICASVLEDPLQTPCEHLFCASCIRGWLLVRDICPIDRQQLRSNDLEQPSRLLRNLLAKQELKCDFELDGCKIFVKLENLGIHRSMCEYNPDTEIICKKRCYLQIMRRDQASDCDVHFKNKIHIQDVKISKLTQAMNNMRTENNELNETVDQLKELLFLQRLKIERLELAVLEAIVAPFSKVRFLLNADRDIAWLTFENMKTHHNIGVLESNDKSRSGVAQLVYKLDPSYPYFSLCVVKSGPLIGMGLAHRSHVGGAKSAMYAHERKGKRKTTIKIENIVKSKP